MFMRNAGSDEESRSWCKYFLDNALAEHHLPWNNACKLSAHERVVVESSIQQFQLGEGSQGRRLLKRGIRYSRRVNDPHFPRALYLFIKEEQRHSAHLLRFMEQQGIQPVSKHWIDSVFRDLRGLAGLELSLRVLVPRKSLQFPTIAP